MIIKDFNFWFFSAICKTHGCQNNSTCGVENNKFICKCIPGYFGDKCSSSKNL